MSSAVLERKSFQLDTRIFKEGDEGNHAYLIQSGTVVLTRNSDYIATIGPGGIIGEMALIDGKPRSATATAETAVNVIVVGRSAFEQKMKTSDPFIRALLKILADTVRRMNAQTR